MKHSRQRRFRTYQRNQWPFLKIGGCSYDKQNWYSRPFAEILRIAADLHFSLIVMGIRGRRQGGIEEILFGSTAEKVLRAARIPVVCVPPEMNSGAKQ